MAQSSKKAPVIPDSSWGALLRRPEETKKGPSMQQPKKGAEAKIDPNLLEHPFIKQCSEACGLTYREKEFWATLLSPEGKVWTRRELMEIFGGLENVSSLLKRVRDKLEEHYPAIEKGFSVKHGGEISYQTAKGETRE